MNLRKAGLGLYGLLVGLLFIIIISITVNYFSDSRNWPSVLGQEAYGLPSYQGPCTGLVKITNETYIESQKFADTNFPNQTAKNQAWDDLRNHYVVRAFELGQFCEDNEAEGRLLYLASSIEFIGGTNKLLTRKEVIGITQNYYDQAEKLGYNKRHPLEAAWLKNRITRLTIRFKIRKES